MYLKAFPLAKIYSQKTESDTLNRKHHDVQRATAIIIHAELMLLCRGITTSNPKSSK